MLHVTSPVIESAALSSIVGARVLLKLDNTQPSGSFVSLDTSKFYCGMAALHSFGGGDKQRQNPSVNKPRHLGNVFVTLVFWLIATCIFRPFFLRSLLTELGSFKIRGIGRLCQLLVAQGHKHLVSSSGGNAGMAVAYSGRKLGVPVTVVVPTATSEFMRNKIRIEGANVIVYGAAWDEAHIEALRIAEELGTVVVHPFLHPEIWKGHQTIIHELAEQLDKPPTHLVTVAGGGGLLVGLLSGMAEHGWKEVRVSVSETLGAESMHAAIEAGHVVTLPAIKSLATTLGCKTVAEEALRLAIEWGVRSVVVTDDDALAAVKAYQAHHQALVELSCGAGLALLYNEKHREAAFGSLKPDDTIVVVICGGNASSIELIQQWEKVLAERAKQ